MFRTMFEIKKRTGILKLSFPTNVESYDFLTHKEWAKSARPFFFDFQNQIELKRKLNPDLALKAAKIKEGKLIFFSGLEYNLGKNYDWVTNPDSNYKYSSSSHWLEINDYSETLGDIKYVWEKSRFSFIYTLIRDEFHNGSVNGEYIFSEILDWIEKNPVNCGPNWKCSQEISLRVLNWVFALYFYKEQSLLSEVQWQKILNSIFWQINHVYKNINFSRIAVRNNHALTETFALYFIGLLFPFFISSDKWKNLGKKWLEEEILFQIYNDGTFLQYSTNYHRVLIQILTWAIGISEIYGDSFSLRVKEKAYKALNFAYQCQDDVSGNLPNYGANDGAIFFSLNDCEYRDHRPQINALHKILTGKNAYETNGIWEEDSYWYGNKLKNGIGFPALSKEMGIVRFEVGGFYLFRKSDNFTFIRCGNHPNRPSQADNLHIDIWYKGKNLLVDAGSYKYNTNAINLKYFMGSASHNTIMIGNHDQMLKGDRFIWYDWTNVLSVEICENENSYIFKGLISAFRQLSPNITLLREIQIDKRELKWKVIDQIFNYTGEEEIRQYWHINEDPEIKVSIIPISDTNYIFTEEVGWYSSLYGIKTKNKQVIVSSKFMKIESNIYIS
jgi:hypothetical protein